MIIEHQISLDANLLDFNILQHLLDRVKEIFSKKCFKQHGYILEVQSIVSVENNTISATTSRAIFDVRFHVITLKPKIGDVLDGIVSRCSEDGLYVNVRDIMEIHVPVRQLKEYVFDNVAQIFARPARAGVLTFEPGTPITIKILQCRYEKREFKCIGSLNEQEVPAQLSVKIEPKVSKVSKTPIAPKGKALIKALAKSLK